MRRVGKISSNIEIVFQHNTIGVNFFGQNMISFVVPVYRSAQCLPELYSRLCTEYDLSLNAFEIIFVDDCGGDNSWEVIKALAAKDPRVRGFLMSRNYGQHNALLCGIREALGEIIVTLDDDLQHPPEEIHKLLRQLECGYDVVYGSPYREQHGFMRNLASKVTKMALQVAMGTINAKQVSAFRVFRTNLRDAFSEYWSPTVNIDVLLTWGTTNFSAIRIIHHERKYGNSGYTLSKLTRHALNMITGFSILPLQFASLIGVFFAFVGLFILTYVLIRWLLEGTVVPGFVFLSSIITIFSGAQLLALGLIGEYISRIHLRTMKRPPYFVREKL